MASSARTLPKCSPSRSRLLFACCALLLAALSNTAPATGQQVVLLAFGDSITHGLGDLTVTCDGAPRGYPPLLINRLTAAGYNTRQVTSGVCGELTSTGLSRIDDALRFAAGDILLLMEGTNDLSNRNISTESMRFNLNAMAGKSVDRGYLPVLASPIPRDSRQDGVTSNDRTAFLGSLLKQDAAAKGWGWAPTFVDMIDIPDLYDRFYSDPYHPNRSGYSILADIFAEPALAAVEQVLQVGPCEADEVTLCLGEGERFQVEVSWTDFEGNSGFGQAIPRTVDTGFYWYFGPDNYELMIKILDGRVLNDHFWVFYGSLSSVGFTITVTDTETGRRKVYNNPVGELASVGDTMAFPESSQSSAP